MNTIDIKSNILYQIQRLQARFRGLTRRKLSRSKSSRAHSAVFISPANLSSSIGDEAMLLASIDKREYLRQQVQDALPEIMALAKKNLEPILFDSFKE